jgi:hypothetical protein
MKFYETNFDEYIAAVHRYNIHPEYVPIFKHFSNILQTLKKHETNVKIAPLGGAKSGFCTYFHYPAPNNFFPLC